MTTLLTLSDEEIDRLTALDRDLSFAKIPSARPGG